MILENNFSQYDSYINFNSKSDLFHKLLNTNIIQANPNIEVVDKYVKYITKNQDEDI